MSGKPFYFGKARYEMGICVPGVGTIHFHGKGSRFDVFHDVESAREGIYGLANIDTLYASPYSRTHTITMISDTNDQPVEVWPVSEADLQNMRDVVARMKAEVAKYSWGLRAAKINKLFAMAEAFLVSYPVLHFRALFSGPEMETSRGSVDEGITLSAQQISGVALEHEPAHHTLIKYTDADGFSHALVHLVTGGNVYVDYGMQDDYTQHEPSPEELIFFSNLWKYLFYSLHTPLKGGDVNIVLFRNRAQRCAFEQVLSEVAICFKDASLIKLV